MNTAHVCPRCKFAVVTTRLCEKCVAAVKAEQERKRQEKRERE